jgi:DsbC/DsbD-like thiol-disulfide interchange protein
VTVLPLILTAILCAGDEPDVKAELIPTKAEISPGGTTLLGVHLKLEPGWHVYWENPGDSGLATTAQVKGPEGFVIGPVLYPVPKRIDQPGGLVCYGYEDSTCLFVEVTAPESLKGDEFKFTAEVQWLICEEVCFYGEAKLSTKLGRSRGGKLPAPDKRLKPHQDRLPKPLSSWPGAVVELSGTVTKPTVLITLPAEENSASNINYKATVNATFYPRSIPGLKVGALEVLPHELGFRARLSCTFLPSEDHKTPTVRGVLEVATRGSNQNRFLSIEPTWPPKADEL